MNEEVLMIADAMDSNRNMSRYIKTRLIGRNQSLVVKRQWWPVNNFNNNHYKRQSLPDWGNNCSMQAINSCMMTK